MKEQSRQENIIYLALWGMLFAAPVLGMYIRIISGQADSFYWDEVLMIWKQFGIFFFLFFIHNLFIAPLIIYEERHLLYCSLVAAIIAIFILYECSNRPIKPVNVGPPPMELNQSTESKQPKNTEYMDERGPADMEYMDNDGPPPLPDDIQGSPDKKPMRLPNGELDQRHPPMFVGQHDIVATIILVLMFGMNLGFKLFFKTRNDEKKLMALQKENLEQQLEYLKYQINPHFFMNTLNNIHALVDIDPDKAKDTILELSKMMRFVLYEGDKRGVALTREFDFIRNYVTLMRLRYTDKVKIIVELPTETPDKQIAPLMLVTFIENAFKHGISYQHDSFIEIKASIDGNKLRFTCRNSKAENPNKEKGGVGLANVKKRLQLLYNSNYTLHIQDEADIYNVELIIPLS